MSSTSNDDPTIVLAETSVGAYRSGSIRRMALESYENARVALSGCGRFILTVKKCRHRTSSSESGRDGVSLSVGPFSTAWNCRAADLWWLVAGRGRVNPLELLGPSRCDDMRLTSLFGPGIAVAGRGSSIGAVELCCENDFESVDWAIRGESRLLDGLALREDMVAESRLIHDCRDDVRGRSLG
jgi:hypothetical protein